MKDSVIVGKEEEKGNGSGQVLGLIWFMPNLFKNKLIN
jgi:hypothetical protein